MPMPPEPGPGEVLVKVRAVGICGSDMHWYAEGGIGDYRAIYPQVLGHEPAGEVVAAGRDVTLAAGQKVAIEPSITCGHCEQCLAGRHNNCLRSVFMGSPHMPGLFREYATLPAHNAIPVPAGIGFADATIIEPLAVMLHVLEIAPVRLGDTVAVMGAGPIGMLVAATARLAGAARVFIADRIPHRLALARRMGADTAVDIRDMAACVLDETRGRGVDLVFDAAGAAETVNLAIRLARPSGRVVLIGIPAERRLAVDVLAAMAKELQLLTIKRSNHTAEAALELLGRIPKAFLTHFYPLEQTPLAFATLETYADGIGKAIIEIP